jgi:hypothetical protein
LRNPPVPFTTGADIGDLPIACSHATRSKSVNRWRFHSRTNPGEIYEREFHATVDIIQRIMAVAIEMGDRYAHSRYDLVQAALNGPFGKRRDWRLSNHARLGVRRGFQHGQPHLAFGGFFQSD